MSKNKKRASISDELRKEICIYAQNHIGVKQQSIVDFFNNKYPSLDIGRSTIAKILKESKKWLSIDTNSISSSKFRKKNVKFPLLDQALSHWVEQISATVCTE
jgi:centromere protein B